MSLRLAIVCAVTLVAFGGGCGGGPTDAGKRGGNALPPGCGDLDEDGYGVGAECTGPDCDDFNPRVWEQAACDALCASDPHSTGCPCDPRTDVEPDVCYQGPVETRGVGACVSGIRTCGADGKWTSCDGQRLPRTETCDGADDDCDGVIDEGVSNSCGTCDPTCEEDVIGGTEHPWDPENEGDPGVVVDETGALTLDVGSAGRSFLWVPSWSEAFVARIDSAEGDEVARYWFSPNENSDDPYHLSVSPITGAAISTGGTYLRCRGGGGGPGCVVRITNIAYPPCPDTDHDGVVRTSSGEGDLLDWQEDDCMVWSREYDEVLYGAVAWETRMELDGPMNYLWLADPSRMLILELDEVGEPTGREIGTAPLRPAGMEFTPDGTLFVSDQWSASNVARIDTEAGEAEVFDNGQGQKHTCVAVDTNGQVWIPNDLGLSVFHPETNTFTDLAVDSYGIVADDEGRVWQGGWFQHVFWEYDAEKMTQTATIDLGPPASIGGSGWGDTEDYVYAAITADGDLFIIDQATARVLRVDKDDPEEFEELDVDIPSPGACGDLTGIHRSRIVGPSSSYSHVFEGCEGETNWTHATFTASVPRGANVQFSVRVADDVAHLAGAAYEVVGSAPADESPLSLRNGLGEVPAGHFAELRATLSAGDIGPPRLTSFGLRRSCPGTID